MSMSMVEIEKQLKALRLHGMLATLESRTLQANQGNTPFIAVAGRIGLPLFPPQATAFQGIQPQGAKNIKRF
jgi:hypothetical protein